MFRHLSIQLELRYLGMERQTVTFITIRLIIDLGGARSTLTPRRAHEFLSSGVDPPSNCNRLILQSHLTKVALPIA